MNTYHAEEWDGIWRVILRLDGQIVRSICQCVDQSVAVETAAALTFFRLFNP